MGAVVSQALFSASQTAVWSYDKPAMEEQNPGNVQFRGSTLVELQGEHLGHWDRSPVGRMGGTHCSSSVWISDSSLLCAMAKGHISWGSMQPAVVTVTNEVWTSRSPMRYDALLLQTLQGRVPIRFLVELVSVSPNLTSTEKYALLNVFEEVLKQGSVDDLVVVDTFSGANRRSGEGAEEPAVYATSFEPAGGQGPHRNLLQAVSVVVDVLFWAAEADREPFIRNVYQQETKDQIIAAASRRGLVPTYLSILNAVAYYDPEGVRVPCCCDASCPCKMCLDPPADTVAVISWTVVIIVVLVGVMACFCGGLIVWRRDFNKRGQVFVAQAEKELDAAREAGSSGEPASPDGQRDMKTLIAERRVMWAQQTRGTWSGEIGSEAGSPLRQSVEKKDLTLQDIDDKQGSRKPLSRSNTQSQRSHAEPWRSGTRSGRVHPEGEQAGAGSPLHAHEGAREEAAALAPPSRPQFDPTRAHQAMHLQPPAHGRWSPVARTGWLANPDGSPLPYMGAAGGGSLPRYSVPASILPQAPPEQAQAPAEPRRIVEPPGVEKRDDAFARLPSPFNHTWRSSSVYAVHVGDEVQPFEDELEAFAEATDEEDQPPSIPDLD
eukprot:2468426-Rhodomonas_salina.1